jgi:G:T/U-mismatch repair DNA glycosylase
LDWSNERGFYDYIISPEDSNDMWAFMYHGIMTQNDIIQSKSEDNLVKGIGNIIEAHGIGSMASMFGDVPYSKVGVEAKSPFDNQVEVYNAAQLLLSEAITQLNSVPSSRRYSNDNIHKLMRVHF